ncbi:MAG: sulfotransferase [Actinomycetia bacterium]|nr:sulfotransferase [Actinomycetes bacterium]
MSRRALLIYGVTPRSGTNYLHDLLALHPDAEPSDFVYEAGLNLFADELERYARSLTGFWNRWVEQDIPTQAVLQALGQGLLDLIGQDLDPERLMLTKTPYPRNIGLAPQLFPDAHLLIIVRSPTAVVASSVRTWGSDVAAAASRWATGAREILRFCDQHADTKVIKYEDLVEDPAAVVRTGLAEVGLPANSFPFDGVSALPVRGSSAIASDSPVTWHPVDRPADFDPADRGTELGERNRDTVAAVVGGLPSEFGYEALPRPALARRLTARGRVTAYSAADRLSLTPSKL